MSINLRAVPGISLRAYLFILQGRELFIVIQGESLARGPKLLSTVHETATYRCDDTGGCEMQFWPPDDEHMCSKHVEAWNKTYCETNFVHQVG